MATKLPPRKRITRCYGKGSICFRLWLDCNMLTMRRLSRHSRPWPALAIASGRTTPEQTISLSSSGQEWRDWLHDRATHRAPIDAHFDNAIKWISRLDGGIIKPHSPSPISVLELGPGPLIDLRAGVVQIPAVYHAADIQPFPSVNNIADVWQANQKLPFEDEQFDAILAREVFEHVFDLSAMLGECSRILRPGGRLWFSTPFLFPLHDYETEHGGDFWRISPLGWMRMLERDFTVAAADPVRELFGEWQLPVSVIGWAQK